MHLAKGHRVLPSSAGGSRGSAPFPLFSTLSPSHFTATLAGRAGGGGRREKRIKRGNEGEVKVKPRAAFCRDEITLRPEVSWFLDLRAGRVAELRNGALVNRSPWNDRAALFLPQRVGWAGGGARRRRRTFPRQRARKRAFLPVTFARPIDFVVRKSILRTARQIPLSRSVRTVRTYICFSMFAFSRPVPLPEREHAFCFQQ